MVWDPIEKELRLVIEPEVSPYRGPLYFARVGQTAQEANASANGGFCLVETGRKKLLVTCNHVLEGFQEASRKDPEVRLHLCLDLHRKQAVIFDPQQPIDQDAKLDIATFDMAPLLSDCGGRKFYPLNQNPAPLLAKGNRLVVLGNQGMNRIASAEGLELGLTIYAPQVSSVDGLRFHAKMSEARIKMLRSPARLPEGSVHGGISGNPCFLVRPGKLCQLVGFVTGHLVVSDYLCFTHARCLNQDGTISDHQDVTR